MPTVRTTAPPRRASLLLAAASLLALSARLRAADQPQWGEAWSRNMVSAETGLPESFEPPDFDPDTGKPVPGTGKNIRWVALLGTEAYGTPIVAGGKVLVSTNNGRPRDPRHQGDRGVLMCFNEADGRFLWQLVVPKLVRDRYLDWPNVGICSPPTVEGDRVYLVSNRAEVVCLDLNGQADGNDGPYRDEGRHMALPGRLPMEVGKTDADIIWLFDMMAEVGSRQHDAPHCSVLVHGRFVYASTSNGVDNTHKGPALDAPSLVVLDKETGRLVATDDARMAQQIIHSMWSSPSVGKAGGRELIFFGGGDGICYAFEPLNETPPDGRPVKLKTVWRFDCDPVGRKENPLEFQDNREDSPSTISGMPVFSGGRVYVTVGGDIWHGKREAWLKCIDASGTGDVTKSGQVWSRPLKYHCMSTPSVHDGLVYIADCGRTIHCFDARTGHPYWTHRTKGDIWGSTLVADGKVYVGTRRNEFVTLSPGKEKRVISQVRLPSAMHSTPVAANGRLYIVTRRRLFAVERMGG